MVTDWVLIARLAHELTARLAGSRVTEAGVLPDGRTALRLRSRAGAQVLAFDPFAAPPSVTLEPFEGAFLAHPGFARALGALRGHTLVAVSARRGDRLLRLRFGSRSRFGVAAELELSVELVPRFGNLVLVKDGRVVAAAKEFPPDGGGRRAIAAGLAYELPPLPPAERLVPSLLAGSALEAALAAAASDEPLYVYRDDGAIVQAHVVPLSAFADLVPAREASLLDVLAESARTAQAQGDRLRTQRRRDAVLKRLDERERKQRGELEALGIKQGAAEQREELRVQGEAIFADLHALAPAERDEAKERASALFARYKKLGAALPHLEQRKAGVSAALEQTHALRWEAGRVADEDLAEIETALERPRGTAGSSPRRGKRKRALFEVRTPSGSRIVLGRSPLENAEVTFTVARPNDLWFHARGTPGAHVVLARDDREPPSQADVEMAAALAAYHSKARASTRVDVDYVARKFVRKQRDAAPGLVWYTNAKTIAVAPRDLPES